MTRTRQVINQDPIFQRILNRLYETGHTDKELLRHLGLANGSMTQWKYRGVKSYMKYLTGIADFLGTTKSYLLNGGNAEIITEADLSDEEKDFFKKFRAIGEYERKSITEIVDRFYDLREQRESDG